MISNVIGRDLFKVAMLNLLRNNKFSSITTPNFTTQLDLYSNEASLPNNTRWAEILRRYVRVLPASEILRVVREKSKSIIISRLMSERVDLPIDFCSPSFPLAYKPKRWLHHSQHEATIIPNSDELWIIVNPQQFGVYRVDYDPRILMELSKELSRNHSAFENRGQLIGDSGTQAYWGYSLLRTHLYLIQYLVNETDTMVWRSARIIYEKLSFRMRGYEKMKKFYDLYNDLAGREYLNHRIGSPHFEKTMEVGKITCFSGYPECVRDAEEFYGQVVESPLGSLTGSKDFQYFIYCTLAKFSLNRKRLIENVRQLWIDDRGVHAKSRTAIKGFACTSNGEEIHR